jgi:NEDD4-binding protein 2
MRGVSGSGKSTKAKELIKKQAMGCTSVICSADKFFINPSSGRYEFEPKKIGLAHAFCRGQVEAAIQLGTDLIIVDNTNTQKWEFKPYVDLAETHGYECTQEVVGTLEEKDLKVYANRNVHGVPLESIRKMAKRFQL